MVRPDLLVEILEAATFATEAHRGQLRKGGDTPYAVHPLRVAARVARLPIEDPARRRVMILAALLHDVIEDTDVGEEEIARRFGPEVAKVVAELTQDMSLDKNERKRLMLDELPGLSFEARCVKLADRLDNVRGLPDMSESFVRRYVPESRRLLERLRGTCAELERELERELSPYEGRDG